jgi:MATE family multidrug resistance protein
LALVVDALAVAAQALVGRYRGSGDVERLRGLTGRLLFWGAVSGFVLMLLFWGLAPWLPRVFTDDGVSLAQVGSIMAFVVWMQPLNALVFVGDGIFMGLESFRFLAVQMVISGLAASSVLLLVIPMGWGLAGVWWGLVALMFARAGTLAWGYRMIILR